MRSHAAMIACLVLGWGAMATKDGDERRLDAWRVVLIVASALILLASSLVAFNQPPPSTTATGGTSSNSGWFFTPFEENAWNRLPRISAYLSSVALTADGGRALAVSSGGTILRSADGGATWTAQTGGNTDGLVSVALTADGGRALAVGDNDTILRSADGGATWTAQTGGNTDGLFSVALTPDGRLALAVGFDGTILRSADGGLTWQPGGVWRVSPAPWYYAALALALLVLLPAVVSRPQRNKRDEIAGILVADKPLDRGEHDALGLGEMALGLSRFLRNRNTKPPLTIAVTGGWGCGKSSLMNLLRRDLEDFGHQPVWFNAWHYQKEEHLFASLMESIKAQAVPSWWSPRGLAFRARLLWIRADRNLFATAWILAAIVGLAIYLGTDWRASGGLLDEAWTWLDSLGTLGTALAKLGAVGAFAGSTIAGVIGVWRSLTAFGVKPASLLTKAAGMARIGQLEAQTAFRHKFARQFADVTRALGQRQLTIFIDDLDRCHPNSVVDVLEAINFLVSSGDCFVVLGMANPQVRAAIGLTFADFAHEIAEATTESAKDGEEVEAPTGTQSAREARERRGYATLYLQKLINIEIPLPEMTHEAGRAVLTGKTSKTRPITPKGRARWLWRAGAVGAPVLRRWARGLAALLILAFGVWGGLLLTGPSSSEGPAAPSTQIAARATAQPAQPSPSISPTPNDTKPELEPSVGDSVFFQPEADTRTRQTLLLASLAVLATFTGWILVRRRDVIEDDSTTFKAALNEWGAFVAARQKTPREVKRFLNRLRLLAMRQRRFDGNRTLWNELEAFLRRKAGVEPSKPAHARTKKRSLPEAQLVALAVAEELEPQWIYDDVAPPSKDQARKTWPEMPDSYSPQAIIRYREQYRHLTWGVRVR